MPIFHACGRYQSAQRTRSRRLSITISTCLRQLRVRLLLIHPSSLVNQNDNKSQLLKQTPVHGLAGATPETETISKNHKILTPPPFSSSKISSLLFRLLYFPLSHFPATHDVVVHNVVTLSRLSSFSDYQINPVNFFPKLPQFTIQDRVSFPDHTLLLVSVDTISPISIDGYRLECVYKSNKSDQDIKLRNVLSLDEYKEDSLLRLLVRCPLSPENFSLRSLFSNRVVVVVVVVVAGDEDDNGGGSDGGGYGGR
ncbi:hypothetical protein QVD17_31504 [Tagetes erecta]|uniref:Uncharacterized protein n=1 Tax=Tagetes erecta TaxID=13708 RepID=A0AAD8K3I3_TARER|nr:hypothetical protein QVD17_31504 [Tagetes erecta]